MGSLLSLWRIESHLFLASAGGGGGLLESLGITPQILVIQAVGFLLLLWLLWKFLWGPVHSILEARRQDIIQTYDKIEADRQEMERLKEEYEQRLAHIEMEARERIQTALQEAHQLRDQIIEEARHQGRELITRAQEQMRLEREKVLTELRTYVADLALSAAERVIRESLDEERHRRLIEEFIQTAEVR